MRRIEIEDGGWFDAAMAKSYVGRGSELFRTLGGTWVLRTVGPDRMDHYRRISLTEAHEWLVYHGFYPKDFGAGMGLGL